MQIPFLEEVAPAADADLKYDTYEQAALAIQEKAEEASAIVVPETHEVGHPQLISQLKCLLSANSCCRTQALYPQTKQ